MAAINPPSFEQGGSHPAANLRQVNKFVMGGRGGVVSGLGVTQRGAGANMSVDVAEGFVWVPGTEASYQGHYGCEAQGVTNVPISAADATNPRRDLIIARVRDAVYSGAANTWAIEVVTGTPAASPADPALPTGSCWVLARVAVAALASSVVNANITDARSGGAGYTGQGGLAAGFGGIITCISTLKPTVGLYEGMTIYCTDLDAVLVYNGSAWIGAVAGPRPQSFGGNVSTGTATSFTAFLTQNNIGTAPFPLTMVLRAVGDQGTNAASNTLRIRFTDEAGTALAIATILDTTDLVQRNYAINESKSWSITATKDYAAGATMGFRMQYNVDVSNIYLGAFVTVEFWPKAS